MPEYGRMVGAKAEHVAVQLQRLPWVQATQVGRISRVDACHGVRSASQCGEGNHRNSGVKVLDSENDPEYRHILAGKAVDRGGRAAHMEYRHLDRADLLAASAGDLICSTAYLVLVLLPE